MSDKRRLHPVTILFTAGKTVKEAIVPIIAGLLALFRGGSSYTLLLIPVFFILLLTFSIASWYRFSYRVEADELRIEYGIFIRKKRYISKHRIQSIDLTAGVLHRMLRLVQVQIETAGSTAGAEGALKAVKLTEGERLRAALKSTASNADQEEDMPSAPAATKKITWKNLFIAGSTSGSIGVILALFAFAFAKLQQFIPGRVYESTVNWLAGSGLVFIAGLAMVVLILLWLFGIAGTMIKYGNFTITRTEEELFITRGLLEKKQITIPLKRIQAVRTTESVIRQPLGLVTVYAEVAGGSLEKGEELSAVLFPVMRASEAEGFLQRFLPDYATQTKTLTRLPKRAAKFYLFSAAFLFVLITAGIAYFLPSFVWAAVMLLLVSLGWGFLRYKDAGYHVAGKCLTFRRRRIGRETIRVYKKRIQAFEKRQHKVQQLQTLATTELSIIGAGGTGKHFEVKHMAEEQTDQLADWYSFRT